MGFKSHIWKKKKTGSRPGRPAGSPGFGRAVATAGLLLNPDRSSHRVDLPGRAGFNNYAFYAFHCGLHSAVHGEKVDAFFSF